MRFSIGERTLTIQLQHRRWRPLAKPSSRVMRAEHKGRLWAKARATQIADWCQLPRFATVAWTGAGPNRLLLAGKSRRPFFMRGTLIQPGLFTVVMSADDLRIFWVSRHAVSEPVQKFKVVAEGSTGLRFSYWSSGRLSTVHQRWNAGKDAAVTYRFPVAVAPAVVAAGRLAQGQIHADLIDLGSGSPSKPDVPAGGGVAQATVTVPRRPTAWQRHPFVATLPSVNELPADPGQTVPVYIEAEGASGGDTLLPFQGLGAFS